MTHRYALPLRWLAPAVLAACATSAGSGGGGCSCAKAIPSGIPAASVVEKAATLRVTRPGLDFLSSRIGALAARNLQPNGLPYVVDVPPSSSTGISICPNGPNRSASPPECIAEIDFARAALRVDGVVANKLRIAGTIPVRVPNLRVTAVGFVEFGLGVGTPRNASTPCPNGNIPAVAGFTNLNIVILAPLIGSPSSIRAGSTIIDSANADVSVQIPRNDVTICNAFLPNFVTSGILSLAFSTLETTLADKVKSALGDATCQAPDAANTPPCPSGSKPNDADPSKWSKCVMNTSTNVCVPQPLGFEGTADLGTLLTSVAPGAHATLDLLFAARGSLDPAPGRATDNARYPGSTPNGLTLSFGGAALPNPKSSCVPAAAPAIPLGIPVPDELRADAVTGLTASPHLGLGVSERFLSYALGQSVRAGLLCFDVSGERINLVNTAILSLLAKGLPTLTHEARTSAALVRLRPRGLPTLVVGGGTDAKTDPLLTIRVEKIRLEIYTWAYRRWVHAFDLETTIVAKAGLDVVQNTSYPNGAIVPVIADVALEDAAVLNGDLIPDDPKVVERNFKGLITLVASRLGTLSAIDLSSTLAPYGLTLELPVGGVRRLVKGQDRFLGVFLNFGLVASAKQLPPPSVQILPAQGGANAYVQFAPSYAAAEWALSVDGARRGAWRKFDDTKLDDATLALDGNHALGFSVRTVGVPASESDSASATFRVDHEPPLAEVNDGTGELTAWDRVSGETLTVRREDGAAFEEFHRGMILAAGEQVEVRDESGLIQVIRRAPVSESGPSCAYAGPSARPSTPSRSAFSTLADRVAVVAALVALIAGRRRRVHVDARGGAHNGDPIGVRVRATFAGHAAALLFCAPVAILCASEVLAGCTNVSTRAPTGCGAACTSACKEELPRGLTGSYLAAARSDDGTQWFSGYEDMAIVSGSEFAYGDWAVGSLNVESGEVKWTTVAGMPAVYTDGRCADRPSSGYRDGRIEQGTDVGRSTAIAVSPSGTLFGAAYDATNRALVFASRSSNASGAWATHVASVRPGADVGRHVRAVVRDGVPWLFYLASEPSGPSGRGLRSSIEVARAKTANPTKTSDWAIDTVATVAEGPCRQVQCAEADWCSPTSRRCESVQTACTSCDGGKCVRDQGDGGATCSPAFASPGLETSLPVFGDGFALLDEGTAATFAVRDGAGGQLVLLTPDGAGWKKTVVDGDTAAGIDRGTGPAIARTSDDVLQLFSFDSVSGALTHVAVRGTQILAKSVVDDGSGVIGATFDDAPHAFGREAVAAVRAGVLTVFYQDAKLAQLRMAVGTPLPGGAVGTFRWALSAVPQPNKAAGFFPVPLHDGRIANFWRSFDLSSRSALGGVAILTP